MGCDYSGNGRLPGYSDFNPRTPVGCDADPNLIYPGQVLFQSTHPSGVRRPSSRVTLRTSNFNPRTPVGCDANRTRRRKNQIISIHAPQWGATETYSRNVVFLVISIHAPQWGATADPNLIYPGQVLFQSTHPSGVRRRWPTKPERTTVKSIHATQWGETASYTQ